MMPNDPKFAMWRRLARTLNARAAAPLLEVQSGIEPGTMCECVSIQEAERLGVDEAALRFARGVWGAGYEGVILFVRGRQEAQGS